MTRPIKFRVWDKKEQKMFDPLNQIDPAGFFNNENYYEVMQFTGLTDKNGKEIYEGDILRMEQPIFEVSHAVQCVWGYQGWMFNVFAVNGTLGGTAKVGDAYAAEVVEKNFEVIGNIYENKELLT